MKIVHRLLGILIAFCLMWILFITSIQAVVYWNPGYFEKEYTKYQVLDDLPPHDHGRSSGCDRRDDGLLKR